MQIIFVSFYYSSICLPCLKSAETDEKESEDHPPDQNSFENDTDGNPPLENKYPEDLNPFASDEENENPIGKAEKAQREDEYPDTLNPFAIDDEGNEEEFEYPEELDPFADDDDGEVDSEIEQREDEYPDTLNPFAIDDEGNEEEFEYPEVNPFANEDDGEVDSEIEQREDEYPDTLNPFAIDDEGNEEEFEYPEELDPFADEDDGEVDSEIEQREDEYPDTLNPFAIDDEGNEEEFEYPEELDPFADEDDGEVDSEIEQREDEYPDTLNPFAIDDEGNEEEIEYPEVNPFANEDDGEVDSEIEQREDEYPDTLNPFAIDDEENEEEFEYPEELNPFADEDDGEADSEIVNQSSLALDHELTPSVKRGSSATVPLSDEENTDGKDESEKKGDEYPEWLNPFASADEEHKRGTDYPEELNPFAQDDDEVDTGLVNQPSAALSLEKNSPATNGYSSNFPWSNEEIFEDEQDETEQQGEDYPDIINPFPSKDDEDDYPEELNPFAHEDAVSMPQSSMETSRSVPSIYKVIEYDEALNPFASEDVGKKDSTLENPSMTADPQRTAATVNDSSSLVPLANARKKEKSTKKYRAPDPPMTMRIIPNESAPGVNESAPGDSETSGPVPLIVKVDVYDEALNPFASEDEETAGDTAGNVSSSPAQPIAATAYSCTSVNVKTKKAKSAKKYRAPDPPMTMRIIPNESAPGDSETSGPVPLTVKVDDYDEALNPFASEDEETAGGTAGNVSSSPAQPIAATAYSCTSVNVKTKKAKSSKKRRAPDPPVVESTSDIIANQPGASSSNHGTKET
ncbi:hypothetical protein JTE90_029207 [Oedothorax gibbosus]|uniref:Uncharacterized protein n=1 Tax=Oedothorax gibbosus TaxID=931172 RepID=A0AAV6VE38_9ARAC|nr:hypothetical protein JTE90_029207 [Oedothorax gibbosus]